MTDVNWGYAEDNGPEKWGDLAPAFDLCCNGQAQSPIDLTDATDGPLASLTFHYEPFALLLWHDGRNVLADCQNTGHIVLDGDTYNLTQFHFHHPSEHTVDGQAAPLELHLVHTSSTAQLAVVGIMIHVGEPSDAYAPIFDNLLTSAQTTTRVEGVSLNPTDLLPTDTTSRYSYSGSLTTPPCSEGVQWLVLTQPVTVSQAQVDQFVSAIGANARPVQPLNDRDLRHGQA